MGARLSGVPELAAALERFQAVPARVQNRVLTRKGKELLQKALALAPDDDEPAVDRRPDYKKLRDSGTVRRRGRAVVVRFAARHAAAQHERMDWQHDDGQPKFLEQPLREMQDDLVHQVAAEAEAEMARVARRGQRRDGRGRFA